MSTLVFPSTRCGSTKITVEASRLDPPPHSMPADTHYKTHQDTPTGATERFLADTPREARSASDIVDSMTEG